MKEITHIEVPKEWESTNDWDSHRPLLWLCVSKLDKNVIEFGCGEGSTKLLDKFCKEQELRFSSYETNKEYAGIYNSTLVNDYDEINPNRSCILFIDLAPGEQRKYMIAKHKEDVSLIIAHDTEIGAEYVYGMKEILSTFKYRLDYKPEGKPHTTAVSNFLNVEDWI